MRSKRLGILIGTFLGAATLGWADHPGAVAGAILNEIPSARISAMGEGGCALDNDANVLSLNPASLSTLSDSQVSFLYQPGLVDDSLGHVVWGHPSGWGVSVGMYDGGDVTLFNGSTEKTVQAEKDWVGTLGYGRKWGRLSYGVAAKYLSSELAQTAKATAFMMDVGAQIPVGTLVRLGVAYQNLGQDIQYIDEKHSLPQVARFGAAIQFSQRRPSTLVFELPYFVEEKAVSPSIGCEVKLAPVVIRAGYKSHSDVEGFTVGAGLALGQFELDYALGLVDEFDNRQRVSLLLHYGGRP